MSLAIKPFCRFGEFTVDREQKILLRNDTALPLAPKVFDTLLILIENCGRIVQKQEFMTRLWPDSFVEESNLTFNIQQLRKALGDSARDPRFIETVARRGYRFIGDITEVQDSLPGKVENQDSFRADWKRSDWSIGALSVFVVASVIVASWFYGHRTSASVRSAPILVTPFKSEKFATGGVIRADITPDGKYVAYTGEAGDKETIWLRNLETSENIQIVPPTTTRYLGLAISRDGKSLYFVRKSLTNPPTSSLYRVTIFGGIPERITDHVEGSISTSPDDHEIFFARCHYQDNDFCSLMMIDADGKNERKLLTRQRPTRLSGVQISPDGRSLAFASGQSQNGASDFRLMRFDLASGVEAQISPKTFFDVNNLRWLTDGSGLLVTGKETHDGRLRIWHVSATGEARGLTNDATDYISLSLDKADDKMIATHVSNTFHLYLARLDDLNNPRGLAKARVGAAFLPDGKLVYEGNDGDIWTINRDGAEQRQLTNNSSSDIFPSVSPDGHYLIFTSNRTGSNEIWRMNLDGSNQSQVTKRESGYPLFISLDGKWIYFESALKQTIWRTSTDHREEEEVSSQRVLNPASSPDGKLVAFFFRKESDNRMWIGVMSLETRSLVKTFSLTDDTCFQGRLAWLSNSKTFYYVTLNGTQSVLWRQSLDETSPQQIANLGNEEISALALSPDDTTLAFIRGRWIHDAVLIEGLK
jgi:Tol biopolymer transport system component/DNA-binding winged helix-turn-helix (wHTH) protein